MFRGVVIAFGVAVASVSTAAPLPPNGLPPRGSVVGGEWEPARAQVMRWALDAPGLEDIQAAMVDALQDEGEILMLVDDASAEARVLAALAQRGVPSTNVVFLHERTDSIWTRDYGPQYLRTPLGEPRIVDAMYYVSRTRDDIVPYRVGAREGVPVHEARFEMEHGNLMGDGFGRCFYTSAAYTRNPTRTPAEIDQAYRDAYGCTETIVLQPLPGESTGHIDMFARMTDAVTWLVGEYSPGQIGYAQLEANAALLSSTIAHDGLPFRVIRLPMPPTSASLTKNDASTPGVLPAYETFARATRGARAGIDAGEIWRTHANSVIANDVVLVPTYGLGTDAAALAIYRDALPDHRIVGIDSEALIILGGALHCIVMQIPSAAPFEGLAFAAIEDMEERSGNGDLGFDPGETWSFQVRLANRGPLAVSGARARVALSAGAAGARVLVRDLHFPTIPAGSSALSTTRAVVAFEPTLACGAAIALDLVNIADGAEVASPDQPEVASLVAGTHAATTLFADDFESEATAWTHTADGAGIDLWRLQGPNGCYEALSPAKAWTFVDPGPCQYYTASTAAGFLDSPPIAGISSDTRLDLAYWRETDFCSRSSSVTKRDHFRVQVSDDDFATRTTLLELSCKDPSHAQWIPLSLDLSAFAGSTVRLRFWFDSDDGFGNRWRGAGIDDVVVEERVATCAPFAPAGPGALVVDGRAESAPLTVSRAGEDLVLRWGLECNAGARTDYAAYAGSLEALRAGLWDHVPLACEDDGGDREMRIPEGGGSRWFVVVPHDGAAEGRLGASRPPSAAACYPSSPATCEVF